MTTPLAKEMETYQRLLPSLIKDEGKYALIMDDRLLGVYVAYEDALNAGYEKAKLVPFLVKRISGSEAIAHFSRDTSGLCPTTRST